MSGTEPVEPPASPAETPEKPRRSTAERILVQGGIAVLLVILAIEATSYIRHSRAHSKLMAEIQKAEEGDHRITRDIVQQIIGDRPPDMTTTRKVAVGEERYDVYYFDGLLKRRELCIHYGVQGAASEPGSEPEVIEVTTIVPDEILAN